MILIWLHSAQLLSRPIALIRRFSPFSLYKLAQRCNLRWSAESHPAKLKEMKSPWSIWKIIKWVFFFFLFFNAAAAAAVPSQIHKSEICYSRDQLDCVMFVGIFFLLDTLNVTVILI